MLVVAVKVTNPTSLILTNLFFFFFFFEIAYSLEAIRIREEVRRCSGRKGEKGKGGGERTKTEDFVEGKIVYSELMYDIDYQPSANLCK